MRLQLNRYDPVIFYYFPFKGWIKRQWIDFHLFKRIKHLSSVVRRQMTGAVIKRTFYRKQNMTTEEKKKSKNNGIERLQPPGQEHRNSSF